jgi:hypothetical protein
LYIIPVLIVLNQDFAVVLYITIPVAVDANHRMVSKFITDA